MLNIQAVVWDTLKRITKIEHFCLEALKQTPSNAATIKQMLFFLLVFSIKANGCSTMLDS